VVAAKSPGRTALHRAADYRYRFAFPAIPEFRKRHDELLHVEAHERTNGSTGATTSTRAAAKHKWRNGLGFGDLFTKYARLGRRPRLSLPRIARNDGRVMNESPR